MAASEKPRSTDDLPVDLMPLIEESGLLQERQCKELRSKVLEGTYPIDSRQLAQRLVKDRLLTEYQARRLLSNKPQGLVVGRYIIMDRLGSGSMGRVYKAHHQLMDRVVALKIIAPEIVSNKRIVARFEREMRLVGRLDHPNVVRAFDADQFGEQLFIVMEYVPGRSLGQIFRTDGVLAPVDVANYGMQAAYGLAHAHDQGVVHRDVKPSNLLLSDTKQVKVLDLGLGVLMEADEESNFATADGIAVGTIDYMSPEQACGKEVDGRSDVFSLGCTMYHLITGKLPYPGDSPIDRLGRRLGGDSVPIREVRPDVPEGLVKVLEVMMASKPSDRYQKAGEAGQALQALLKPRSGGRKVATKPAGVEKASQQGNAGGAAAAAAPMARPLVSTEPLARPVAAEMSFPGWFRPLARVAERAPGVALVVLMGLVAAGFAAGFVAARLMSSK